LKRTFGGGRVLCWVIVVAVDLDAVLQQRQHFIHFLMPPSVCLRVCECVHVRTCAYVREMHEYVSGVAACVPV
jgi:hypothetical protein